eukprot:Plantae.Rhodophyta-Palmaria_palmata.ctg6753.p1 GENE.Plantae.Rhodophyta-Palmaria_palmata.ctg6753~~Plantae.Rhodophyta-Palmaria_palmata.ctg6753.p1  ORF type:complete len:341 (+),score=26.87 Plantae.Rhodophyta-Palmaria_palmata.ctg6753:318-1340(+)
MPWTPAKFTEFDDRVVPSFLPNNLVGDGEGRFAFAHGGRVQCTRRRKNKGRNDYTLAMKTEGVEVIELYWWAQAPRYPRPLLVLVTDAPNVPGNMASLQVWDTRSGRGTRVFNLKFNEKEHGEVLFGRGLSSALGEDNSTVLFVGLSSGDICGYSFNKTGLMEESCRLKGLPTAVSCVAGDKVLSPYIAASDENGQIMVWQYKGGSWKTIYRYNGDIDDFSCCMAIRGRILVAGHASGTVTFHDLDERQKFSETITNSKGITTIDMHPTQGIILVTGEDCRATVLTLPTEDEVLKVVLSVCLNAVILGGVFTCAKPEAPDITLQMWERSHLVHYEFVEDS